MVAIGTDIFNKYQLGTNKKKEDPNKLLQKDFLKLMTEQLKHQDPMKPTDNGEFLGQMAQFSTASGLKELQSSFSSLANTLQSNQALMAASLIDKQALIPASTIQTSETGEKVNGAIALPASTSNAFVNVLDAGGNVVQKLNLGGGKEGLKNFSWDGLSSTGDKMPPGDYSFQAFISTDSKGATEAAPVYINSRITSISLDEGKISVNTQNGEHHNFSDILRIG